jgi:hypothetical protein
MTKKHLTSFIIASIAILAILVVPCEQTALAQAGKYSCGTYSAGDYSEGDCTSVKLPNTGFARLTQPGVMIPAIGSVILIAIGVTAIVFRMRKRKAQD